ncbi:MAG: J domain-containing protein [Campylobacterales bacterium]|nr:J domain-containing protein [Campylobacterales bacterium]
MIITLEKNAIILTPKNNSINLKPLLHYIDYSFQRVNHFSNSVVILNEISEEIKKKYLLKWAYKIYEKGNPYKDSMFFQRLITSYYLPIHVIIPNNNSVSKMATITIDQINSYEISVSCNQHQDKITQYFKLIFKDSMTLTSNKSTFNITVKTKVHLSLLKSILSRREILNIPVTFIAHGLSFKRMHPEDTYTAEYLYKEKLQKSYMILSISDDSTAMEMKKNYRNMLKKYHPDIVYNQNDDLVKLYTRRFQVIQNAYEFVKEHRKIA